MVVDVGLFLGLALGVLGLISGSMVTAVSLLLYRQKGDRLFRDFGLLVASMGLYALCDLVLMVLLRVEDPPLLGSSWIATGLVQIVAMGLIAGTLVTLLARMSGLVRSTGLALVAWSPLGVAMGLALWMVASYSLQNRWPLQSPAYPAISQGSLGVMLLWLTGGALLALVRRRTIHDRLMRRIVVVTVGILLVFLPVWVVELIGLVSVRGFSWFYLIWNVASLALAARAWFGRESEPLPVAMEFGALEALVSRYGLTPREAEILQQHLEGKTSAQIGEALFISPKTVRNHVSNLYQKTGAHSRFALLRLAQAKGRPR